MKKSRLLGVTCACISAFTAPQAMSQIIDTYFGWNFVGADISTGGTPIILNELALDSITYIGETGTTTQNINFGSLGGAMPDWAGLATKPTDTYPTGDGQSTRNSPAGVGSLQSLPIDWIPAGTTTPWGSTYAFPTIGITGISAFGVSGFAIGSGQHVIGLIPFGGTDTELDSSLGGLQSDIYTGDIVLFTPEPLSGIEGEGGFIFSGAAVVPIPAAAWLFGSGIIGLIGVARRKKS